MLPVRFSKIMVVLVRLGGVLLVLLYTLVGTDRFPSWWGRGPTFPCLKIETWGTRCLEVD